MSLHLFPAAIYQQRRTRLRTLLRERFDAERWMDWQQTTLNGAGGPAFVQWIRVPAERRDTAAIAACLICSGVSKSGSPAPSPITSLPAAFSSAALAVTASVGEGFTFERREAMKLVIGF